VIHFI
jgi:sedoheptulose-bisphosphatase